MLEKAHDYLTKLFKTAYHSILKSFRLFLPLFIAIFLIESILFSVYLSFQNNIELRHKKIENEYPHHLVVSGLTEAEMLLLCNDDRTVSRNDMCFDVIKTVMYESTAYDPTYTVYIKILTGNKNYGIWGLFIDDSLEANYDAMHYRYRDVFGTEEAPNQDLSLTVTPLYTEEQDANQLKALGALILLLLSILSAVIFYTLYCVYLSDKKFAFGIYSAFGATRRELKTQAMAELLIASALSILPSYYLSSLLCFFNYRIGGSSFSIDLINLRTWLFIFICATVLLYTAISFAMKSVTNDEPMKLLTAEEGTNSVSNTKRSSLLLSKRFPFSYEMLSVWRFRRHHISLALFSTLLGIVFVVGSYFSVFYTGGAEIRKRTSPHFTAQFSNVSMLSEDYSTIFKKINKLESAYTIPEFSAAEDYAAFLQVDAKDTVQTNGLVRDKENDLYYTGKVALYTGAFDVADYFTSIYDVSGSPSLFASNPQGVLIGKTVDNKEAFDFSVGDRITLAVAQTDDAGDVIYAEEDAERISNMTGRSFWKAAHDSFAFDYYTFTVVGIIENYPSGVNGTPIVMHPDAYAQITGKAPCINQMTIRLPSDATTSDFLDAESALRGVAARLGHCTIVSQQSFFENTVFESYCYAELFRTVTLLFLLFLPLAWIYSQALFFKKREKEFYVLGAISASPSEIRSIYFYNILVTIPIALLSFAASLGISYEICFALEQYLPSVLGISETVMNTASPPIYIYFVSIAVTLPSCLLSLLIPYLKHKKRYFSEQLANNFHDDN